MDTPDGDDAEQK